MLDYIFRDAAIAVLCDACGNAACPKGKIPRCSYFYRMQEIPAADVRPVVRGKWELSDDRCWHTCSICGADIDVSVGLLCYVDNEEVCNHNFCPNCGADMRGEQNV